MLQTDSGDEEIAFSLLLSLSPIALLVAALEEE